MFKQPHRKNAVLLLILLGCAGITGNYFAPHLFIGFYCLFGSIPVLIGVTLFGIRWGLVLAITASSWTILLFGHPYALLWLCGEPLFVGWLFRRMGTRNIILYDAIYWPLIGAPMIWLVYVYLLQTPKQIALIIFLLYWTIGLINAVAASLMITYVPFQKFMSDPSESRSVPIHELIFNLMMGTAILPTIVIVVSNSDLSALRSLSGAAGEPISWSALTDSSFLSIHQPFLESYSHILFSLLFLNMLALATSLYTSRRLAAPLHQLTRITTDLPDRLMNGKVPPWPESMVSEIDQLSYNFRTMATALSYKFREITYYSETLEARVKERTKELTKVNNELRKEITERLLTEKERDQLLFQLQNKNKELESIVYVASHDLRSPLVNVQGFSRKLATSCQELDNLVSSLEVESAKKQQLDKILQVNIPKYIGFITGSIDKMGLLLKGLLRLSRLGQASLCFDRLDMNSIMEKIISSMTYQIQAVHAQIIVEDLAPCTSDAGQVTQVFSNLLDNTIKFNSPHRPLVVNIFCDEYEDGMRYCVEDNGIGIPNAYKDKIWEIFHRLNPDETSGEGMGLTLAHQIVSRLGGSIWVESDQDAGSRFYVMLPKTLSAK